MSDLERFFQLLVANLAALDPRRLHQPLQVAEILRDVLPYRANRRALGIESAEDYEALVLRLCAGDGGLARTDPPEIQTRFRSELATPNPDLSLLHAHGDALVSLTGAAVARALATDPHAPYAPATPPSEGTLGSSWEPTAADPPAADETAELPMCLYCGGPLPAGRQVNFCPHCGQDQTTLRCPACQTELEYGWRHCVNCGARIGDR